jgi:hypothetical protein
VYVGTTRRSYPTAFHRTTDLGRAPDVEEAFEAGRGIGIGKGKKKADDECVIYIRYLVLYMGYMFVGSFLELFVSCVTIKWHTHPSWAFHYHEFVEIRFG